MLKVVREPQKPTNKPTQRYGREDWSEQPTTRPISKDPTAFATRYEYPGKKSTFSHHLDSQILKATPPTEKADIDSKASAAEHVRRFRSRAIDALAIKMHSLILLFLLGAVPLPCFFDDVLNQMFGAMGGGNVQFSMGGGQPQQQQPRVKFPKGVPSTIADEFSWLKGTEWNWNDWNNVQFHADGNFIAPTHECQGKHGRCLWSADKARVYIMWGNAGLHRLRPSKTPTSSDPKSLTGIYLTGERQDGEPLEASFVRVFDMAGRGEEEAKVDLYTILNLEFGADIPEIKKSFRKMSVQFHPDKNPGEAARKKFDQIREANEVLSDPVHKSLYDTGGMEAVEAALSGKIQKGQDSVVSVEASLALLYTGGPLDVKFTRRIVCAGCRIRPDLKHCAG